MFLPTLTKLVNMHWSIKQASRLSAIALAASVVGLPTAALALPQPSIHVEAAAPQRYVDVVTDESGVLSPDDIAGITEKVQQFQQETRRQIRIIFVDSFDDVTPEVWTTQAVRSNGDKNVAVFAVAVKTREFGINGGDDWDPHALDNMYNAAYDHLLEKDWAGAAYGVVDQANNTSATSSSPASGPTSSVDNAWLGAGALGIAATGGGLWAYSRRKRTTSYKHTLESARSINPRDTQALHALSTDTLAALAQEELVSTDESIRRAKEELEIAVAEFGAERTRAFRRAMNDSTTTLHKAFALNQQAQSTSNPAERHALYVQIASTCGLADDALDAEAANFAQLRNLLVNADSVLLNLTQRIVDLRQRLPGAASTLESVSAQYSDSVVSSIRDNLDIAKVSIAEADRSLDAARELSSRPAGEQAGLVDAIRNAENAANNADKLIAAIEHADANISTARSGIPALITEISEEIAEAQQLRESSDQITPEAGWAAFDASVVDARSALEFAHAHADQDPLETWSTLTAADSALDIQLAYARDAAADHERRSMVFQQQLSSAQSSVQTTADFISTRGRVIKSAARTRLAEAEKLLAHAHNAASSDVVRATDFAREADRTARSALSLAKRDYRDYQQRQSSNRGGGMGGIITGMVLNEILSNNHRGGFGGGFGGGGGGGGGGFRGGSF